MTIMSPQIFVDWEPEIYSQAVKVETHLSFSHVLCTHLVLILTPTKDIATLQGV
jgi:hypothetical protein